MTAFHTIPINSFILSSGLLLQLSEELSMAFTGTDKGRDSSKQSKKGKHLPQYFIISLRAPIKLKSIVTKSEGKQD